MDIKNSKKEIDKKPWWYLFFLANIFILIGCALTYYFFKQIDNGQRFWQNLYLPTLICNALSFVTLIIFIYFDYKDITLKIMHFQKKWIYFYIISICIFVTSIIFSTIFFIFLFDKWPSLDNNLKQSLLIIYLGITILLSLLSIGVNRYARFKIDLDVYRRRHGQNTNN